MNIMTYDWLENVLWIDEEPVFRGVSPAKLEPGTYTLALPLYSAETHCVAIRATGPAGSFLIHDNKKASGWK